MTDEIEARKRHLSDLSSQPLDVKIRLTQLRIEEWYYHYGGNVYISFSGGKDSTVLLDIARKIFPNITAVFCDTGLEFPEIREFVKSIDNVVWLKPKKTFKNVIDKYGYPVVSKEQSQCIYEYRTTKSERLKKIRLEGHAGSSGGKISKKWLFLLDAPFDISHKCCYYLKKQPFMSYEKKTNSKTIVATMVFESALRKQSYLRYGCNSFDGKRPMSKPMSFWKEKDIWDYIKSKGIKYSNIYDMGYDRTGCVFCMFGNGDTTKQKFDQLQKTHNVLYNYCMDKLGLKKVLEYTYKAYKQAKFRF